MRPRGMVGLLLVLSLVLWGGLIAYVNLRSPATLGNLVVLLLLVGAAVTSLVVPISCLVNQRLAGWMDSGAAHRAWRQGLLAGLLAVLLLSTQMMRVLTPVLAVVLVGLAIAAEVMLGSRR